MDQSSGAQSDGLIRTIGLGVLSTNAADIDAAMQRLDVVLALNNAPSQSYVLKHPHMKAIQTHDDFPALVAKHGQVWKDQSPNTQI